MTSNFWQHCPISVQCYRFKKKRILQHFIFFKNEACVNCGTHKVHIQNLVTVTGRPTFCARNLVFIWNRTIFNIIHWVARTNESPTKCLMFHVLFFIISQKIRKIVSIFFFNSLQLYKNKELWVPYVYKKLWINDNWNIRPNTAYYIEDCRIFCI